MKNSVIKRCLCAFLGALMLLSFCACSEEAVTLETPEIVSVRDGYVYWDEVAGANSYVIDINGAKEEVVSSLKCNIEEMLGSLLEEGVPTELRISVKAKGNQLTTFDSEWSEQTVSVYTKLSDTPKEDGEKEDVYTDPGVINASKANRYHTQSATQLVAEASELESSFKDDKYWYYVFYLGDITRVPLEDRQAEHFDGVLERTLSFTYSTVETETISNSAQTATEKCDSWSKELSESLSESTSKSVKVSSSISMLKISADAEVAKTVENTLEKGFVNSFSGSSGSTWTDSYERAHEYSETVTTSTEVTFTRSVKPGYYRYILMGTVSVYAVVVYDPATEQVYVSQISDVKASYRDFDYSENPVFDRDTNAGKLEFDVSKIVEFVEPIDYYGEGYELPGVQVPEDVEIIEDGGRETPYLISSPEDFSKLSDHNQAGVYFALTCDIDFTDKTHLYSPLAEFKGIFDGKGYAIRNWTYSGNGEQIGFFRSVTGTVKNVIFEDCCIERATNTNGENLFVGVVCGVNLGRIVNVQVISCSLKDCRMGEIETNNNSFVVVGLIAGENSDGGLVECCGAVDSTVYVTAKSQYKQAWAIAGGLVGRNSSSVENCYSRDNFVHSETAGAERFMGLQKAKLYSCSAGLVGEITGSGSLKYSIAYFNNLSSDATGGENHEYVAFLVSKNDGAVFNCYGRTSNIKSEDAETFTEETAAETVEETVEETLVETAEETEAAETAETVETAEAVDTAAPETEAPEETEAETKNNISVVIDPSMSVVHPLIATGVGSASGVATADRMLLQNLAGFSKELWKDTDAGALIIHENLK